MTELKTAVICALFACFTISAAMADSFSEAEQAVDELKSEYEDLKSLTIDETKSLVTAICDSEEDDRKTVSQDISSRVKSKIEDEYEILEGFTGDALEKIEIVLNDPEMKDKHSDAEDLQEELESQWQSIIKMTTSLRGANHPVVSWMLTKGQDEHKSRQGGYCDVSEFTMGSMRVDCLTAPSSTCKVIELKPKNSRAISKGRTQVSGYAVELNKLGDAFEKLKKLDSDFGSCQRFEAQVDCYTLCPDIDSDGNYRSTSASWSENC